MERDDLLALAGRLLLSSIFLASAVGKLTNFDATTGYMESHGMPWTAFFCVAAILIESAGGFALAVGYQVRWAAGALAVFLIAATLIFHLSSDQRVHLLKNLAILGGLLEVMAFGPGRLGIDWRARPQGAAPRFPA